MTYPKGIMLYDAHLKTDGSLLEIPDDVDFVVISAIVDRLAVAGFNIHVQEAYNAYKPCIALVDVDPTVYSEGNTLGADAFPPVDKDPYIKVLDKLLLTPTRTSMYAIHGIMLDIRYTDATNSGGWIVATTKHLKDLFKERYFNVPIYVLTNKAVLNLYPNNASDPQVFLSTQKKLCTYSPADSLVTFDTELISDPVGSPSPNWIGIKYWWYGSQEFDFLSDTNSKKAPIFEYRAGDLTTMYSELNYTRIKTEDTPSEDTPIEDTPSEDTPIEDTSISETLNKILELLNKIYNKM